MTPLYRKPTTIAKLIVLVLAMAVVLYAFSSGPPPGHTGGFGEPTCQICHGFEVGSGSFSINGVPSQYTPGQVYPITVQISQSGQSRWGFQLASRLQSSGVQAGRIEVTDPTNTQVVSFRGIQYVQHTSAGTRAGVPDGPVTWTFNWTAPDATDAVQFNSAGNAANNDGTPNGDFIYTASQVSSPPVPTFCVSGVITLQDNSPLSGVTVTATGPSSGQDTSGSDGRFSICNLAAGSYTVQPARAGYNFSPSSRSVSLPPSQGDVNFVGTPINPTSCVSGRITFEDGSSPVMGILVRANGPSSGTDITRSDGTYSICNLLAGMYSIQPTSASYTFDAPVENVTVPPDQTDIDFFAIPIPTFCVSGVVRGFDSTPIQGVLVTATGPRLGQDTTAGDGSYRICNLVSGAYTIRPQREGYAFDLPSRDVALPPSQDGIDFTGIIREPTFWSDWQWLGGSMTSAPAAASSGVNRIDVFARGAENALFRFWWNGASWNGWQYLAGYLTAAPAAASSGPNRMSVFIRGPDNSVYLTEWDGLGWSDWGSLGGTITSDLGAVSPGPGLVSVFGRGLDNALWYNFWNGAAWSGWQSLGGWITSGPAAASWGANHMDVSVQGADGTLFHKSWNGLEWTEWESLGGNASSGPAAASWAPHCLSIFTRGPDNELQHKWFNGTRWNEWRSMGGTLASAPAAVSWGPYRLDVFVRASDGSLYQKIWDNSE